MVFKPVVKYSDDKAFEPSDLENTLFMDDNKITLYNRDKQFETDFIDFMAGLHPDFEEQKNSGRFYLPADSLLNDFWFFDAYESLEKNNIEVFGLKELKLIKNELLRDNIDFEYLDGQSSKKQRQESVTRFQDNPACRVFLISLKAGGTGLNLTAADYVYIVDPWWNPAVENQAIDRTHRIGQGKKVFAYRMICKNTVEEKIMNLQAKKRKIATDIITTDESIVKKLTINDVKELFS